MVTKQSLHVKKGDTVKIISGRDKGKVGEILKILPVEKSIEVDVVAVVEAGTVVT